MNCFYISPITVYSDLHFELMQVFMYFIHIFGIVFFWATLYISSLTESQRSPT